LRGIGKHLRDALAQAVGQTMIETIAKPAGPVLQRQRGMGTCMSRRQQAAPFGLLKSEAIFGEFAKHWHLGLGLSIIACVALLPRGLVGVPEQLAARLRGRLSGAHGAATKELPHESV
jgi:hypothetical protein